MNLLSSSVSDLKQAVVQGLAAAESALSELLGRPVQASLISVTEAELSQVDASWLSGDDVAVALYQYFDGSLAGHCLLLMEPDAAAAVSRQLWDATGAGAGTAAPAREETDHSALLEFGNILTGRFLSGMADHLQIEVLPAPPARTVDTAAALFNSLLAAGAQFSRRIVTVAAAFSVEGLPIPVTLALIPTRFPDPAPAPGRDTP